MVKNIAFIVLLIFAEPIQAQISLFNGKISMVGKSTGLKNGM